MLAFVTSQAVPTICAGPVATHGVMTPVWKSPLARRLVAPDAEGIPNAARTTHATSTRRRFLMRRTLPRRGGRLRPAGASEHVGRALIAWMSRRRPPRPVAAAADVPRR